LGSVHLNHVPDLAQVRCARHRVRRLSSAVQGRQEYRNENRDDSDHDEQFDKRKSALAHCTQFDKRKAAMSRWTGLHERFPRFPPNRTNELMRTSAF